MPYIKKERRKWLDEIVDTLWRKSPGNPGELNYLVTRIIEHYACHSKAPLDYQKINDIMGALEGAKLEFYRRVVAPYENSKIQSNGDVYE